MHTYIASATKELKHSKVLIDKTVEVLDAERLHWVPAPGSNSIAIIMRHITANIQSRFTDFLHADGEKSWRDRDAEFEELALSKEQLLLEWEQAWSVLFTTLASLGPEDLERTVYIRSEAHSVIQAINRQVAHYASHMGQVVFIGKLVMGTDWQSLSIPRGQSKVFNSSMLKKHQEGK